jgi:hypothetical protein
LADRNFCDSRDILMGIELFSRDESLVSFHQGCEGLVGGEAGYYWGDR